MKASELLIRCLENEGIDAIYGIPGEVTAVPILRPLDSGSTTGTASYKRRTRAR